MRAVIYARVSTEDQAHGTSLDSQVKACREYCERKGYTVLDEYRDDISGASASRPGMDKIIELADSIDVVVCYSVDRFSREFGVHYLLEKELASKNTAVEFTIGSFEDTPEGQLYKHMSMAISQFERAQILRRSRLGLRARAMNGKVMHGRTPPLGYRYEDGYFYVEEEEAEIIQQIFDWYVNFRLSIKEIAIKLDDYETKLKNTRWATSSVHYILTNRVYIGEYEYGDLIIEVPPIIEKSTFIKAEKIRTQNRTSSPRNTKKKYLVQGHVACSCGYNMMSTFRPGRKRTYQYYRCYDSAGVRRDATCNATVRAGALDKAVWAVMEHVLLNPEVYRKEYYERVNSGDYESVSKQVDELQKTIKELADKKAKLIPLYQDDLFTREELDNNAAQISQQIAKHQKEVDRLMMAMGKSIYDTNRKGVIDQVWIRNLAKLDFEQRRQLVKMMDVEVTVTTRRTNDFDARITGVYDDVPFDKNITVNTPFK